jgi:uncharacterized membrane protein
MRFQLFVSVLLSLISWPSQAQLSYLDVKSIIDDNCVVCHAVDGVVDALPFQSLDQIRGKAERMKAAITTGRMPLGNPDFAETRDGQLLLDWLGNGADLYPPSSTEPPPLITKDPRELTFADVEPILRENCQICHARGRPMAKLPLTSLNEVRSRAKKVWKALDRGEMPPNDPDFVYSIDGRVLMGWLRYGRDLGSWDD